MKLTKNYRVATEDDFRHANKIKLNVPFFTRPNNLSKDLTPQKTNKFTDITSFKQMIKNEMVLVQTR